MLQAHYFNGQALSVGHEELVCPMYTVVSSLAGMLGGKCSRVDHIKSRSDLAVCSGLKSGGYELWFF